MELNINKKTDNLISGWSGGTTSQIGIYPDTCNYENRDFIWRVSSAVIEVEESNFTSLPDYNRILLVLEGEVILSHEAERVTRLSRYEQDRFDGAGSTRSFGKIKDFNLMVRKDADATLNIVDLIETRRDLKEDNHLSDEYAYESRFFFCDGEFSVIVINGVEHLLKQGDTLVMKREITEPVEIGAMGRGKLIVGIIQFDEGKIGNTQTEEVQTEEAQTIPREKAGFDDLKVAAYLSLTNCRGNRYIFKGRRETWQDKELQKAIGKIENVLLPFIIGITGVVVSAIWAEKTLGLDSVITVTVGWLLFDVFILNPLLYFIALPKPIRAHIKKIEELSDQEKCLYEEEKNTNRQAEKILKKYTITGRNVYKD